MKGPGQVARTSVRNINKPQLPEGCPSIEKNSTFADTIDMDFLTDPIFSDLGRSDFIGGIDNEALDFGHLEQFMQVAGSVSPTGGDTESTKAEPTSSQPSAPPTSESHHHIPSAAGRVGIGVASATTPIATPLAAGLSSHAHPHLPESPPDSGSEPPYSPLQDVHGLTLTSRDLGPPSGGDVYTGTGSGSVSGMQPHPHHLSPQFTPPHQQQHPHNHHHIQSSSHFQHSQPQHFLDIPHLAGPDLGPEVRIKHEAGLIINASSLGAVAPPHPGPVESHLEVGSGQHQTQYAGVQYEAEAAGLFDGGEFHNMAPAIGHPPVCMMSPDADASRVHVVGTSPPQTSRPSAPSTPTHRSSTRKRKMSAQLDCPEFPGLKGEPELSTSPSGGVAPGSYAFPAEAQKLGPTSPVSISLPAPMGEFATPALSTASLSPALSTVNSNQENSMDGSVAASGGSGDNSDSNALTPCIRFSPFQPQNWHKLCDQSLQELSVVYYRVDADKGFNFSVSDDAFVCQKKNHFQVTCHARLQGDAKFVRTPSGLEKIKAFHLHFYGVKLEAPNQTIRVEQSQSDRSKKPFYPVPIDLQSHIVSKITVGRLHFSETTNNNMRKKGRPNPEQRYFQLVVGLHVHTMSGNFPVISQGSERIIVRASNPGQFESDVDLCWQRGVTHDSIFHAGRVGINTDRPDESLVVHGNLKVSGHIVQPSDSRAKQEIGELDTSVQLRNLQKIRIVRYRYEPEFAIHSGLKRASDSDSEEIVDTGVIAQEVREVIPDAVQEGGSIVLPNGNVIENFLLVNKDRILMENIGAVKELCKVTGSLETRIDNLERMNNRLTRAKEYDQRSILDRERNATAKDPEVCSNRNLQIIIFLLVIVMAACLAAVSTLYFVEHNRQDHNHKHFERLQKPHHVAGGHHDPLLLSEQEQHYLQLRQFLHSNASKGGGLTWPPGLFGLTTSRPPPPPPPPVPAHPRNSSKSGQELTYNESGEFYSASGRTDELAVVMEKPVVSLQPLVTAPEPQTQVSTSAPPSRNNKTISNKGKVKWPLPQVVVRTTASLGTPPTASTPAASAPAAAPEAAPSKVGGAAHSPTVRNSAFEETLNTSETSSEKSGEPISQDFENNSIDIDARQSAKKPSALKPPVLAAEAASSPNSAAHEATLVVESGDADITLNLGVHGGAAIASTSSSNSLGGVPDTTATANSLHLGLGAADSSIYSVYKAVSPPTAPVAGLGSHNAHTLAHAHAHGHGNFSLEPPALSNKSQGVLEALIETADALDLQNLSNNNESADNPVADLFGIDFTGHESVLGRRSTSEHRVANEWIQERTVDVEPVGAPAQCKGLRDDAAICQSVCFEDSNQLPSPSASHKNADDEHQPQQVDSEESGGEEPGAAPVGDLDEEPNLHASLVGKTSNSSSIVPGKISHASQAIGKLSSQRQSEDADALETLEQPRSEEHLYDASKLTETKTAGLPGSPPVQAHHALSANCWRIASTVLAAGLNATIGEEEFCPLAGKSLNLTYIIPLSRYFKESSFEVQFSSLKPLLWTICNNESNNGEHTKLDPKHPTSQRKGVPLRRERNTSALALNIPNHGYFVRDLELRASDDLTKDLLCQEQASDANTFLQYNIRILRECD